MSDDLFSIPLPERIGDDAKAEAISAGDWSVTVPLEWTWDDTLAEMRRGAKLLDERAKLQADGPLPPDTGRSPERRRRAVRRKA